MTLDGKINENILIGNDTVRRIYDKESGIWYFSVVDVIGLLTESQDARNYWKVLKNRLKKNQDELITRCRQLKMHARDGKLYLTDVADAQTMLSIIDVIPGSGNSSLRLYFESFLKEESVEADGELMVDMYESDSSITIEAMIAGIPLRDIYIYLTPDKITIRGKRDSKAYLYGTEGARNNIDYIHQELHWPTFSRTIELPHSVHIDKIEKKEDRGHLVIGLQKVII